MNSYLTWVFFTNYSLDGRFYCTYHILRMQIRMTTGVSAVKVECACHALVKHLLIPALQMVKMTSEISVIATTGLVLTQSTCRVKIGFTKYLNLYDVSYGVLI